MQEIQETWVSIPGGDGPWRKRAAAPSVFLPGNWQSRTRLSRHAMTSSISSCWFTSKLLFIPLFPLCFFCLSNIWNRESFFWVPNIVGCAIIPMNMLNAHWPLSSWPSKNTRWLTHMFGTEYIWVTAGDRKAMLSSFHGPARQRLLTSVLPVKLHTAEEQTGCPSGLLKQTKKQSQHQPRAVAFRLTGGREAKSGMLRLSLFPKVLPKMHVPLPSFSSELPYEAPLEGAFSEETQQFTQAQLDAWSIPNHPEVSTRL